MTDPGQVPLFLLHGFTGSSLAWGEPVLRTLERRGPLVAVDLPGHGDAQRRSPLSSDSPPDFEQTVDELARLPAEYGWERVDWAGYSMGGRLALALAIRHPERVRRLVLESTSPGLATASGRRDRRRSDDALARRILSDGIESFVSHWMGLPLFRSQQRLPAEALRNARERRMAADPEGLAAVLRGLGTGSQPSYWDELARLERPVLILSGELDPKYVEIGRAMAARLPDATRVEVDGAGHTVHLEAPEAWEQAVVRFLERPPTPRGTCAGA